MHDHSKSSPLKTYFAVWAALLVGTFLTYEAALIDRIAVEIEFHDVVQDDKFWAARPRHEKTVGALRMPHADMAEPVNHFFRRQNTVGYDEVF